MPRFRIVRRKRIVPDRPRPAVDGGSGRLAGVVVLLGLACAGPDEPVASLPEVTGFKAGERIAQGPASPPGRRFELFRPLDLAVVGDSIFVVDNGNDQILVLDRDLVALGVLGREGQGPGEYQQPVAIRRSPGGVMVADMGNGRLTEIDRAGTILRTMPAPPGLRSFAVTAAGAVVVPSRSGTHHFARVRDGATEDLGVRPGRETADVDPVALRSIAAGFLDPRVAVTAGDTVHVLDEQDAILYKYSPEGTLLLRKAIPAALRDSAVARRAALTRDLGGQGHRVLPSPLSKGLTVTPDGRLLLLLTVGETFALLVDPGTYAMRRIALPSAADDRSVLRAARAATVVDSVIYLLRDESVFAFRLRAVD